MTDKASGELIATVTQTTFCRADGGFGGRRARARRCTRSPSARPISSAISPTRPEMALIYRLSGDLNPLHADPDVAKAAGFPRADPARARHLRRGRPRDAQERVRLRSGAPQRHWRALLRRRSFRARPSAPRCGATAMSSASARSVPERDIVAINNGRAEVKA